MERRKGGSIVLVVPLPSSLFLCISFSRYTMRYFAVFPPPPLSSMQRESVRLHSNPEEREREREREREKREREREKEKERERKE